MDIEKVTIDQTVYIIKFNTLKLNGLTAFFAEYKTEDAEKFTVFQDHYYIPYYFTSKSELQKILSAKLQKAM